MDRKAFGSTADVLYFALMIAIASFLLLQAEPLGAGDSWKKAYAKRLAQSTLLVLQQGPVRDFGALSYRLDLPIGKLPERTLRQKTITQLIAEDVLLNPKLCSNEHAITFDTNREFDEKLNDLLRRTLDEFIRNRFGYRLIIQMPKIRITDETWICFKKVIEDFEKSSERLCSERIALTLLITQDWMKGLTSRAIELEGGHVSDQILGPSEKKVRTVTIVLELWSD